MRMYLPFGDYWNEGHGRHKVILVDAPTLEHPIMAQNKLKEKYGRWTFTDGMANNCEEPYLSEEVWQALIDTNYPVKRLCEVEDCNTWEDCKSLWEALEMDPSPYVSIDFVIDAYIWLLNAYGAKIIPIKEVPICDIDTVGYGCFY